MNIEAEDIRKIQNKFRDYKMSDYFENFEKEYDSIPIKSIGPGENMTEPKNIFIEDLTFRRALFTALERIAPILKSDPATILLRTIDAILSNDRHFYYFLENAKDGLRKTSERMCTDIIHEGKHKYEKVSSVIIYIYIYINIY